MKQRHFCVLFAALAACGGAQPAPVTASTPEPNIAELERQRDDAVHRANNAQLDADRLHGECQLAQHELDSLRERKSFEQSVWSRLGHAEISERALRDRQASAPRDRKRLEPALKDAATAHDLAEQSVRRVYVVSDVEWPRFTHDVISALDGLDRTLADAQ